MIYFANFFLCRKCSRALFSLQNERFILSSTSLLSTLVQIKMNSLVSNYYRKLEGERPLYGHFHEVIPLHENGNLTWKKAHEKVPSLPKGWYEMCQLSKTDRIEFVRDFWQATLPFTPHNDQSFHDFFDSLDDVGVYLLQWGQGLSCECDMVYSVRDGSCFYRGAPCISVEEIQHVQAQLGGKLPKDFLQFLQIHNGHGTDQGDRSKTR